MCASLAVERVQFVRGSPQAFHVRTESQRQDYQEIQATLRQAYCRPGASGLDEDWRVTSFEAIASGVPHAYWGLQGDSEEDAHLFYRVSVRKANPTGDVLVVLVDFGEVSLTEWPKLLHLPSNLADRPPQVTFCAMYEYKDRESDHRDWDNFGWLWSQVNNMYMIRLPLSGPPASPEAPIVVRLISDIDVSQILQLCQDNVRNAPDSCAPPDLGGQGEGADTPKHPTEPELEPDVTKASHSLPDEAPSIESSDSEVTDCGDGQKVLEWLAPKPVEQPRTRKEPRVSIFQELPRLKVQTGDDGNLMFVFAFIESPERFFIYPLQKEIEGYNQLCNDINTFYDVDKKAYREVERLPKDSLVAVHLRDEAGWFRGRLLTHVDSNTKEIFLLDHGETLEADVDQIRILDRRFCQCAPLAQESRMADLKAVKLLSARDYLVSVSEIYTHSSLIGVPQDPSAAILELEVIAEEFKNQHGTIFPSVTVGPMLLAQGFCAQRDESSAIGSWNPISQDYESQDNFYKDNIDPHRIPTRHERLNPERPTQICRFYKVNAKCYKGQTCQDLHVYTGSNAVEEFNPADIPITQSQTPLELPRADSDILLQVSCVISPDNFWAIMPWGPFDLHSPETHERLKWSDSLEATSLASLVAEMTSYYAGRRFQSRKSVLRSGEIVAAQCPREQKWYRARIMDREYEDEDESILSVFFVDFGNSASLKIKHIRAIEGFFLKLPFHAVQCSLANIAPLGEEWMEEGIEMFYQNIIGKSFMAHVEYVQPAGGSHMEVSLSTLDRGQDIGDLLVKKGYALRSTSKVWVDPNSLRIPG